MRSHACAPRETGGRPFRRARTPAALAALPALALALACAPAPAAAQEPIAYLPLAPEGLPSAGPCAAATSAVDTVPAVKVRSALRCVVDVERARHGLRPLVPDARLARAAQRHARDMVRRHYFAHERAGWTLAGRLRAAGWSGSRAAEALAWGCGGRATPLGTVNGWLKSAPHRAIVLGNYSRAGIGLAAKAPSASCPGGGTWVLNAGA